MSERVVETRGATLRCKDEGPTEAPTLVLSSSLGTSLEMWDRQVPRLSSFFRVVRYDHRGHGGSSAPAGRYTIDDLGNDVLDLLDALGVEKAALCGLSLGGMAAMWLAAHHPSRVSSIVVACSAPVLGPKQTWYERADTVRRDGAGSLLPALTERWFPPEVPGRRPDLVREVGAMLERCDAEGYASCCAAIAEMDLRPVLAGIDAPALVIGGAYDPVTPPSGVLELASELRGALVVLRDSSHLANLTEPDAFTDAVLSHVAGDPARRGSRVRRAVLGDEHVERSAAPSDPLSEDFTDFVTRYAWGEVWSRPGLDRRTRSAVTLALLISLGRYEELAFHVPAALRNGLGPEEIGEVVLHSAIYAGVPAAHAAIPVVREAIEEARSAGGGDAGASRG